MAEAAKKLIHKHYSTQIPIEIESVKEPNDIEKISSELAKLEKRIREELARWDSQFRELTTEEQLQHFRDKVDAFKRENDKELDKFNAEKLIVFPHM